MKRLHVIDIFENHDTFLKLNYSVPTDDFLDVINEFDKDFFPGSFRIVFNWIDERKDYVSEIITQWGLCFTYNIAFSHDVLHINSTSEDFHYQSARKIADFEMSDDPIDLPPNDLPQKISSSKAGLWVGFRRFNDDIFNGFTVIVHDPFELPSANSKIIDFNFKYQTTILIDPQQQSIDESLVGYDPAE